MADAQTTLKDLQQKFAAELAQATGGSVEVTMLAEGEISLFAESMKDLELVAPIMNQFADLTERAEYPEDGEYCWFYKAR